MNLPYEYFRLVMQTHTFSALEIHVGADDVIYTLPGKSLKQSLRWKLPVIISPLFAGPRPDKCTMLISWQGQQYELYEDANDVARNCIDVINGD